MGKYKFGETAEGTMTLAERTERMFKRLGLRASTSYAEGKRAYAASFNTPKLNADSSSEKTKYIFERLTALSCPPITIAKASSKEKEDS